MNIRKFSNSIFNSNSYILSKNGSEHVFLIDPGDSNPLLAYTMESNKNIVGIFLTHSHFNHIYGVNEILAFYPEARLFVSQYSEEGMKSEKLNGSLFKGMPFVVKPHEVVIIKENDVILLWDEIFLRVIETPGHDRDCLSFLVDNHIFTGDSLIPGIKVFTKFKYGNKSQSENSIRKLMKLTDDDSVIWPGHGENCIIKDLTLG